MSKVLIVHPDLSRLGGIENYYRKLYPHLDVDYESLGNSKRTDESGHLSQIRRILSDYYRYWKKLSDPDIDIVHLNPSLSAKMFYREGIYLALARFRNKITIVFFHGWDNEFQNKIDRRDGALFRRFYGKADAFIVLASRFSDKLRQWGATCPIYHEVIIIEDDVLKAITIDELTSVRLKSRDWNLLFPSRIMRTKGIMTTIRALKIVQKHIPGFGLVVAGAGEHLHEAKALVKKLAVNNVSFVGIVSGHSKQEIFRRAHVLCFPTEHSEGFPNIIVEAMAFGLPVITRPVGGIPDFFLNNEHGFLTESTDPEDYAQYIIKLIKDAELYRHIALTNHEYAKSHFTASQAAVRISHIYHEIRNG